jgi:carboxymethylenebutenolidase
MRVYDVAGPTADAASVLMFPDVLGMHSEVLGFARRVGGMGFRCLVPDVYYREQRAEFRGMAEVDEMLAAARRLRSSDLADDIRAVLRTAALGPGARVATIGFCRGGSQAVLAAGAAPEVVVTALAVYPTRLLQESSDTGYSAWFPAIRGEVRVLSPSDDHLMPHADLVRLSAVFEALGVRHQIRIYPDAVHGWSFPSRPEYHAAADQDMWHLAASDWRRLLRDRGVPSPLSPSWVVVEAAGRDSPSEVPGGRSSAGYLPASPSCCCCGWSRHPS